MAQETPQTDTPVVTTTTPPPPVPMTAPEVPAPSVLVSQPTPELQPAPVVIEQPAAKVAPVKSVVAKPVAATTKPVEVSRTTPTPAAKAQPQSIANPAPAPVVAVTPADPSPTVADATIAQTSNRATTQPANWGLIGGIAAAIALLAFAVIALLTRRRRAVVVEEPMAMEPAFTAAAPMVTPVAPMPTTNLATASSFEAAAEQGPTADNPFLTRRARMRRAHFYDRQARLHAAAVDQPSTMPAPAPAQPADRHITYVFGKNAPNRLGAKPALRRS
jgi:hypothetical protein